MDISNHKEIELTKGFKTIINEVDFERVAKFKWCVAVIRGYPYAVRSFVDNGKKKRVYLHRYILNAPQNLVVDHRNHNTLDNTRDNLRLATRAQNCQNRKAITRKGPGTNKKGVQFIAKMKTNPWKAMFWNGNKMVGLGYFSSEDDAYQAFKVEAVKRHGEFFKE